MGPGAEAGTTWVDCSDSSNNDAPHTRIRILATAFARVLQIFPPSKNGGRRRPSREGAVRSQEGRREDRVRAAPAVSCAKVTNRNAHEHTGSAETLRPSLRNGFTTYLVLSPVRPGLLVTVTPQKRELPRSLTPAIGASGPHDFAVRFTRPSSKAHPRPPLPVPRQ